MATPTYLVDTNILVRVSQRQDPNCEVKQSTIGVAELIEKSFALLPDTEQAHSEWRRLVVIHFVVGVKVHDARLVAAMLVHGVSNLFTLDEQDFKRYTRITVVHPRQFATAP